MTVTNLKTIKLRSILNIKIHSSNMCLQTVIIKIHFCKKK